MIVMLGIGAGFFLWQNQKDVKEVNKNLPAGIKVVKGLFSSDDYVVVNKIDGYEFKLPKEWKGVKDVEYTPEKNEKGYSWTVFGIEGQAGYSKIFAITKFKTIGSLELHSWVENNFKDFGLFAENLDSVKIENFDIIKIQENIHLLGAYLYFFQKESSIYVIRGGSEDFIKYIIENGKW